MKLLKNNILITLILIFAFFIRIIKIDNLTLFGDEIDVAYQAYSLLNTGHDYKGNFLPTYIQSLSESRAPLLIYTTVPFIKIFGLNELGVRFSPIFFGVISILLFYLLVKRLTSNNKLSLFSAFIMSISPWHLHYSRTAFEVTLLLSLIFAGVLFFYKFINKKRNIWAIFSILCFGLCFYTYNTANIFVPLICLYLFISNFNKLKPLLTIKNFIFYILVLFILVMPIGFQIIKGSAANRFNLISIFHDQKTIENIVFKRTGFSSSLSSSERWFHNKINYFSKEFINNYSSAFSPNFLFATGDPNPRHTIPGFGLFLFICLPLFFIGVFNLDLKKAFNQFMLFWLLIAPISSSLTISGSNHATRLFILLPPLVYIIALGLEKVSHLKLNKIYLPIIFVFLFINFLSFEHEYFIHYPKESFENWNYGYKDLMNHIPVNNEPAFVSNSYYNSLLPYLYYQKYSPKLLTLNPLNDQNQDHIYQDLDGFKLNDHILFINSWNTNNLIDKISSTNMPNATYVLFQVKDIPGDWNFSKTPLKGFKTIHVSYNPNGTIFGQIIQKQP